MPTVFANGINIYYEIHGQGEPLILIGGLSRSHTIWDEIAANLSKKYKVIIFDNRGTGQSDKPDESYTAALLADDLSAFMDIIGIKKAHIVGHSLGGFIAQYFAVKFPEKVNKLVLCGTAAVQPEKAKEYLKERLLLVDKNLSIDELIKSVLPWIYSNSYLNKVGREEEIIQKEKSNPYPQPLHGFKRQVQACIEHDARTIVESISARTLVIGGSDDF